MTHGLSQHPDLAANLAGRVHEVEIRTAKQWNEGSRKDRIRIGIVVAEAVQCRLANIGRIHHESALGRRNACETAPAAKAPGARIGKGIVAAGIKHHNVQPRITLAQALEDVVKGNGFCFDEARTAAIGIRNINRQEVVLAADFNAVTCVKQHGNIALPDRGHESLDGAVHVTARHIGGRGYFKSHAGECLAERVCVIHRLFQLRDVGVVIIANHQCETCFSFCPAMGNCQ